jgi:hypothetical protein
MSNAQEQAVRFNFCPRCGKRLSGNPDWVHTCTPPEAYESEISTVTVPENKLTELQIKASQRDELLEALEKLIVEMNKQAPNPVAFYDACEAAEKAITKARE